MTDQNPVVAATGNVIAKALGAVTATWWRIAGSVLVMALTAGAITIIPGAVGTVATGWLERASVKPAPADDTLHLAIENLHVRLQKIETQQAPAPAVDHGPALKALGEKVDAIARPAEPPAKKAARPKQVPAPQKPPAWTWPWE